MITARQGSLLTVSFFSLLAPAQLLELFATGRDLQTVRIGNKSETLTYGVFETLKLLALELEDLFTILTDDMIVMRVVGLVRIVKFIILSEIHFPYQAALSQEG